MLSKLTTAVTVRRSAIGAAVVAVALTPCYSYIINPELHQLWQAALRGDAAAVRRRLRQSSIPPNTRHHLTGARLMLRIAHTRARTAAEDRRLRNVMRVLVRAGWSPEERAPLTAANALHALAWQPPPFHVDHRVRFLVREQERRPKLDNMLSATCRLPLLPEDAAGVLQPARQRFLGRKRVAIAKATRNNSGLMGPVIFFVRGVVDIVVGSQVGVLVPVLPIQVHVSDFEENYRW